LLLPVAGLVHSPGIQPDFEPTPESFSLLRLIRYNLGELDIGYLAVSFVFSAARRSSMSSSFDKDHPLLEMLTDADGPCRRCDFDLPLDLPKTMEDGLRRTFELCAAMESEVEKQSHQASRAFLDGEFLL
jgi:hypothetical protein